MKVCQILLALVFYVLSIEEISTELPYGTDWQTLYFKNGETAHVPCTPSGKADAYFWRKGESYNVSKAVAYNTGGFFSNSTKYRVLSDGYLTIRDFASSDQGTYFCRILSDTDECYGTVNIYLKVTTQELDISIVQCRPLPSCEIKLQRSSTFHVTCLANLVSPTMELVWFNGSEAFLNNASVLMEMDLPQPTISSTITFTYTTASYIACKAIDAKVEDNIAGVLLVDLHEESSKRHVIIFLIIISVILVIVCLTISMTLVLKKRKKNQEAAKDRENSEEEVISIPLSTPYELSHQETTEEVLKPLELSQPMIDEQLSTPYELSHQETTEEVLKPLELSQPETDKWFFQPVIVNHTDTDKEDFAPFRRYHPERYIERRKRPYHDSIVTKCDDDILYEY